jgi:hypothetical protein
MAAFTIETVTTTIYRWVIPADEPWGATAAEVTKALEAARRAYWTAHDIPFGGPLPDDALRFRARDEAIVIEFATEEPTP